jgi:hypothetical protein
MTPSIIAALILAWILAAGTALGFVYRRQVLNAWREPVLSAPVLIVESDDWGYGPPEQAQALRAIAVLLLRHRDASGHPAVMTLGVILAGPDTSRIAAEGCSRYHRITLADPVLRAVNQAMAEGAVQGVFTLQLHGMEHFLAERLLTAAQQDAPVRAWLTSGTLVETERLPARLQSRWIDATALPSKPLSPESIQTAVREEVEAFKLAVGVLPEVAVPPTFVWTSEVEHAWCAEGVRVVITPGRRYVGRDAADRLIAEDGSYYNGQRSTTGCCYLVRDAYFEPARGHRAEDALDAITRKTRLGRPTLLETHRANFLGDSHTANVSLQELHSLLTKALERWPRVRFMSSAELARHYAQGSELIEKRLTARLHCCLLRLAQIPRLRRLAWWSLIALPIFLLLAATRNSRQLGTSPLDAGQNRH